MRLFYRSHLTPAEAVAAADAFFPSLGLQPTSSSARGRSYSGALGTLQLIVRPEGGHYTFVDVSTDQIGESRLDRNVKRFFVRLHRLEDPRHTLEAAY